MFKKVSHIRNDATYCNKNACIKGIINSYIKL